ncbi:hypothetical protein KFL_016330010 [Klebsormidium nitens]|uniref:Reverse transcriptase Ty1/copia-type domain-containing protein n=1 Tax=Klebsormidium nitens TaxID=105231 RepID=A0A1Y1IV86_KLENI|nr:hypothetical protein KFL_016330010 [Klebsormidium nitens]|eukprot:GAQ93539.1 hypothetical protein KFL_016330010 [Klebsormidium nitens]
MDEETHSLLENGTWKIVENPERVKPFSMKWVYKIKRDAHGNVEEYKSRLMAKGYQQKQGIDFDEVYAPELGNSDFVAFMADEALFTGIVAGKRVYLVVWVDDILVAARGAERIAKVKPHLLEKFDVHDLGEATYFLGMELTRNRKARTLKLTECVGSLLYLSVCTRPDIAQAVGALARYMAGPTEAHWRAALGVVRYLAGTAEDGVTFGKSDETLVG